ncbi:MAG TPA: A/G-specific adenine glycosylase [Terriglobia bacterium]|nr:A/G-specific adenine glycosylase [Terriglobia bacterium]
MTNSDALKPKSSQQQVKLRRALLAWYRRCARPLPWRNNSSPYAVWVSEVMLQQTQVANVIPYYLRFLQAFPTLKSLAQAKLERVLELWSGLGYYRRARNLHAAARRVAAEFDGCIPSDYPQIRSLPGVGDYTARAILSIAYQQPFAVMDGNVARVVARLKALKGNINQPRFRSAVELELQKLLSRRSPGDFNQALMELGQTVCFPRAPQCTICPCHKWCEGYRRKMPEAFPAPRPRRATELHYLAAAIIIRRGRLALVRGLDDGLLMDLWNFPGAFGKTRADALRNLDAKLTGLVQSPLKFGACPAELRHTITHRSIRVHLYPVEFHSSLSRTELKWFPTNRLNRSAISQLARKISEVLREGP